MRKTRVQREKSNDSEMVRITFGPHYFVEITQGRDEVSFVLGATHHGFKADASKVNGQLEQLIEEIRSSHPDSLYD